MIMGANICKFFNFSGDYVDNMEIYELDYYYEKFEEAIKE